MRRDKHRRSLPTLTERWRKLRRLALLAVLLAAAVGAVYAQVWRFDFVLLDDPMYVSSNLRVQAGLNWQNIVWSFDGIHVANWTPLTWLSLMLDTDLWGPGAAGYHATNVLLHVVNTLLVFAFLMQATGRPLPSACAAALFGLHPLRVESVAWIAERKDVLSALFGLLALVAYVDYATRGRRSTYFASLGCFACSLLSKQTLVTLPFVFLLLDFWPLGRIDGVAKVRWTRLLVEKAPFFALSVAFCGVALLAQAEGRAVKSFAAIPLTARIANGVVVYATYLGQTVYPHNLAVYYPHPGERLAWGTVCGAAGLLIAVSGAALFALRRYPFLFVGWCWYLGTLVPLIGIVQVGDQQMADRYTYFPSIGLFLAATWLAAELTPAGPLRARLLPAAAVICLAVLAAATFVQVGYWRDSVSLFRHAHECAADNPLARSALGYALLLRGETKEGVALLESAVQMAPPDGQTEYNLAVGLQAVGRADEAAQHYRAALAINEADADAQTNLGVLLCERHQYAEAKKHFLRAVAANGEHVEACVNLGMLGLETGEFGEAIQYSQRALALDPRRIDCHQTIALALRAQGRLDEAIQRLEYVLTVAPGNADARRELARTRAMQRGS